MLHIRSDHSQILKHPSLPEEARVVSQFGGGDLNEYQGAEIAVEGGLVRGTLQAHVPHHNRRRLFATYETVKAYVRQSRHV